MILWSPVGYSKPNSTWSGEQGFVFAAQNAPSLQMKNNPEGNPEEPTGIFLVNTENAVSIELFFSLNNHYERLGFVRPNPQHPSQDAGNGDKSAL